MSGLAGKTILVVDDEEELRELVCWELQRIGVQTLEAGSGREALEILRNQFVDAIVSDVRMPNGTGIELLDAVKADNPDLPVVVLITGHSDLNVDEAFAKGAGAYIHKPFSAKSLVTQLEFLLAPRPERWEQRSPRVGIHKKIGLAYPSLEKAFEAHAITLGRGGLFVACDRDFPSVDTHMTFRLETQHTGDAIEGEGIVRWVRIRAEGPSLPAGFGLEFQNLTDASRAQILRWVEGLVSPSYIPKS